MALASAGDLTSWDSFVDAARGYGAPEAVLWACLVRELAPASQPVAEVRALFSTRPWADGRAALHAYRPRWHIENDGYRELKEGWALEERHWGRDEAAPRGRLTLTRLAFNTGQVYRSRAGERLATVAIRRLRQQRRADLGAAPAVVYLDGCYAVLALEKLLAALGTPTRAYDPPPRRAASLALPNPAYLQLSATFLISLTADVEERYDETNVMDRLLQKSRKANLSRLLNL